MIQKWCKKIDVSQHWDCSCCWIWFKNTRQWQYTIDNIFDSIIQLYNKLHVHDWSHLPHSGVFVFVVMRLTPRFLDLSFKALHQAALHWLSQLFRDRAHSSRAPASSSAAPVSPPTVPCWKYWAKYSKYWAKYSTRVTRDAMKSVTMHSHCGSSRPKDELGLSRSDILCKWNAMMVTA